MIVMEGRSRQEMEQEKQKAWESMSLEEHMRMYEDQGVQRKGSYEIGGKRPGSVETGSVSGVVGKRVLKLKN